MHVPKLYMHACMYCKRKKASKQAVQCLFTLVSLLAVINIVVLWGYHNIAQTLARSYASDMHKLNQIVFSIISLMKSKDFAIFKDQKKKGTNSENTFKNG